MNKADVLERFVQQLESRLAILVSSAMDAKDAATNEESKPENKYDTRGLEASYLAGAQAKRANELKDSINRLRAIKLQICTSVAIGALVKVLDDEDVEKLLFVVPTQGGEMIEMANHKIMAVSPDAPIAKNLMGKKEGDFFEFTQGGEIREYEVLLVK